MSDADIAAVVAAINSADGGPARADGWSRQAARAAIRVMAVSEPRAEDVARVFHEAYERLAPSYGYETRPDSAVAWSDVPEPNRGLMIAVAGEVLAWMAQRGE